MNKNIFSKNEQAALLLDGRWVQEVMKRMPDITDAVDALEPLTIAMSDVLAYARKNPVTAEKYFERLKLDDPSRMHDIFGIWKSEGLYKVAWMDHGTPRSLSTHHAVEEAVAKHISLVVGLPLE